MTVELLAESDFLHEALVAVFDSAIPYPGQRFAIAMNACGIAFEHAGAVRSLISAGLCVSATALLRVQFEAVTRAMWLLYAASEEDVKKLLGPLDEDTQKAANKLPMAAEMLKALERHAPATAVGPLLTFKMVSAGPMNSFIHSGIHPLQRHRDGFPALLRDQLVRSSNGLNTICGMVTAVLTGNPAITAHVREIQARYLKVLPSLE